MFMGCIRSFLFPSPSASFPSRTDGPQAGGLEQTPQLPRTMSGSMVPLQLGSVVVSMACVSRRSHWDHAMLSQPSLH